MGFGLIENIGVAFLHILVGFGGFLVGTVITNIVIVKSRMKKNETEEK